MPELVIHEMRCCTVPIVLKCTFPTEKSLDVACIRKYVFMMVGIVLFLQFFGIRWEVNTKNARSVLIILFLWFYGISEHTMAKECSWFVYANL